MTESGVEQKIALGDVQPVGVAKLVLGVEVIVEIVSPEVPIFTAPSAIDYYLHLIRLARASKIQ